LDLAAKKQPKKGLSFLAEIHLLYGKEKLQSPAVNHGSLDVLLSQKKAMPPFKSHVLNFQIGNVTSVSWKTLKTKILNENMVSSLMKPWSPELWSRKQTCAAGCLVTILAAGPLIPLVFMSSFLCSHLAQSL